MKRIPKLLVILLCLALLVPVVKADTPASLNQRMATRSGPGTQYTEDLGTLPQNTPITLIETVTTKGTPWGMVEFYKNNMKYRAYTGMKRINAYGSVSQGSNSYTDYWLEYDKPVYYGPGYDYAQRSNPVPAGTWMRVFDVQNGFALCDYQSGDRWVRGYIPDLWSVAVTAAPSIKAHTPARLNQRMATRSGPGTQYTEDLGTLPQSTPITVVEYVTTRGTPWGMVEFYKNNMKYRAYTGMKRIDAYGPVALGTLDYYEMILPWSAVARYGPGYDYAARDKDVLDGTRLRVFGVENGFYLCDYQDGDRWVRAWIPDL